MPTFNNRTVINYIKRLTPTQRRVDLEDLLSAFPDDWLNDALVIAQGIRQKRGIAPPRQPDPRLIKEVPYI